MKKIRLRVWAPVFVALGVIGLCLFYHAKSGRVDSVPLLVTSTQQVQHTSQPSTLSDLTYDAHDSNAVLNVSDPKADSRALLLASLGFGTSGGHKVSISYTNGQPPQIQKSESFR
jgi:hypothetical protein